MMATSPTTMTGAMGTTGRPARVRSAECLMERRIHRGQHTQALAGHMMGQLDQSSATFHSTTSVSSCHRGQKVKTTIVHHSTSGRHQKPHQHHHTPSVLFTKVKERIREKVFQSSEWPNAAAMMAEKRQRANDLLEASLNSRTNLNLEQIQLHDNKHRKKVHLMTATPRAKSDSGCKYPNTSPGVDLQGEPLIVAPSRHSSVSPEPPKCNKVIMSSDREEARDAFRRRSISEDTYNTCVIMKKNGIVCSNEDLEYIMQEQQSIQHSKAYKTHQNRRPSPRPLKKHHRTQSLDIARLTAGENLLSAQRRSSNTSVHSQQIYLDPQTSMESSSSTVSSMRTIDSAHSEMNLRSSHSANQLDTMVLLHNSPSAHLYPEIVLDDRTKETIMEENKDTPQVALLTDMAESSEESEPDITSASDNEGNKNKPTKPVPEIVFDENGQTWDVYGAEFDPEVLGIAIQQHLEKMMERMMTPTINEDDTGDSISNDDSNTEGREVDKTDSNSSWVRLLCLFTGRK